PLNVIHSIVLRLMASRDVTTDVIILTQTVVGILGNFSLFCHYIILYFTGCRSRSTDVILQHLIVANFLTLLSKGVPQTMAAFGCKLSPSDFGCKLLFFLHRVGRGVSMGSICLLCVFQVIMISPQNSRWAVLQAKAPQYILPSMCLCWTLQMLVNTKYPLYVNGKLSDKNKTKKKDLGYCSAVRHDKAREAFMHCCCYSLMFHVWGSCSGPLAPWFSSCTDTRSKVQHIRRNNASPRSLPESRATRTILLLVSSFVYFYTLSSIFQVILTFFDNPSWFLVNISAIMAAWFPTVSPFLLMSRDSTLYSLYFAWIRNAKSPAIIRTVYIVYLSTVHNFQLFFPKSPQKIEF
uniref:Vomeronasal type-1 receptor n=1 Tax=Sus scrofa TaxID=9823 RepID=A0A8D1L5J1_PIG